MKRVRLIRNSILRAFAESVYYNQTRLYRLWIVSPWIGFDDGRGDAVLQLIESLRGKRCELTLFTRPPTEIWHLRAIGLLKDNLSPIIYQSATLHTKLYVLECNGFRSAILGSPNLTPRANRINQEIAVEFRSTNDDP